MSLGQDELRGRAEGRSAYVLRHLGGWLLGTFVILFGLFSGLAGACCPGRACDRLGGPRYVPRPVVRTR